MSFEAENPKKARYCRLENEKKNSKKPSFSVSDFGALMKDRQMRSDGCSETDSDMISIDFTQGEEDGRAHSTSDALCSLQHFEQQSTEGTKRSVMRAEAALLRFANNECLRAEAEAAVEQLVVRLHTPAAQFEDFSHLELYGSSLLRCASLYRACAVESAVAGLQPVVAVNAAVSVTAACLSPQAHSFHAVYKCRPNDLVSFVAPGKDRFDSLVLFATLLDNSVCFVEPRSGDLRWKVEMRPAPGMLRETKAATTVGDYLIVVNSDWQVQAYHVETSQLAAEAAVAGAEAWDSPLSIEAVSEDCVVVFSLSSAFVVSLGQKRVERVKSLLSSSFAAKSKLHCGGLFSAEVGGRKVCAHLSLQSEQPLSFETDEDCTILDFDVVPGLREALLLVATKAGERRVLLLRLESGELFEEDRLEVAAEASSLTALTAEQFLVEGERSFWLHRLFDERLTRQLRDGLVSKLSSSPVACRASDN